MASPPFYDAASHPSLHAIASIAYTAFEVGIFHGLLNEMTNWTKWSTIATVVGTVLTGVIVWITLTDEPAAVNSLADPVAGAIDAFEPDVKGNGLSETGSSTGNQNSGPAKLDDPAGQAAETLIDPITSEQGPGSVTERSSPPPARDDYLYVEPSQNGYVIRKPQYSIRRIRTKLIGDNLRIELLFTNEEPREAPFWINGVYFIDDTGTRYRKPSRGMSSGFARDYPPGVPEWVWFEFDGISERAIHGTLTLDINTRDHAGDETVSLTGIPIRESAPRPGDASSMDSASPIVRGRTFQILETRTEWFGPNLRVSLLFVNTDRGERSVWLNDSYLIDDLGNRYRRPVRGMDSGFARRYPPGAPEWVWFEFEDVDREASRVTLGLDFLSRRDGGEAEDLEILVREIFL